jgi:hypothetical protein
MFNLGTKTVVLNSNANVTEANGVIAGFGTLQSQQLLLRQEDKGNFCCKNAVAGVYTITRLHLMTILKRTTLYLVFAQKEYCLISLVIDVWTSNLKQVVLTLVGRLLQLKLQDLTIR